MIEINFINLIFLNFILLTVIFGILINVVEPYLPAFIIQSIRFGKHSYQGPKDYFMELLEVPKSWYKHFYVFAAIWSMGGLYLCFHNIVGQKTAPLVVVDLISLVAGEKERFFVDSTSGFIAMFLLVIQCGRRFYETHFIQVFSSNTKMNFLQYLVGYLHYFGSVVAILMYTEGFVQNSLPSGFNISKISGQGFVSIVLFFYAWWYQYKSNLILANMRKDSSGKVKTERHLLPVGGYFEYVSSPHMFFEVLIYVAILGLITANITWKYITFWVICNQTETAWLTHKWYKNNFKDYPAKRYAIYPFAL